MASGAAFSRGAAQPARVPWAMEFKLRLDRHRPTTCRLAADGRWYTWIEFPTYYREHARAMWEATWEREERMARPGSLGALALPVERRRSWRAAWRWCSFVCSLAGRRAACRGAVLRQMVDQRIDGGPCRRLVPPKDWPEAPALAGQGAWDDYNWDDVWGPDITVITPDQLMPPLPTECDYHSTEFMQAEAARFWEYHLCDGGPIAPLRDSGATD